MGWYGWYDNGWNQKIGCELLAQGEVASLFNPEECDQLLLWDFKATWVSDPDHLGIQAENRLGHKWLVQVIA
jgi:hypothetical protein